MKYPIKKTSVLLICLLLPLLNVMAQGTKWAKDGGSYYRVEQNEVVQYVLPANERKVAISKQQLTPAGQSTPLKLSLYAYSEDQKKVLIFTNTKKVWRINTRGDYWVLNLADNSLKKLGGNRPASSLMFAKFSPDDLQHHQKGGTGRPLPDRSDWEV